MKNVVKASVFHGSSKKATQRMKEITNVIADVRKKLSTFISSGEKKKVENYAKDDVGVDGGAVVSLGLSDL